MEVIWLMRRGFSRLKTEIIVVVCTFILKCVFEIEIQLKKNRSKSKQKKVKLVLLSVVPVRLIFVEHVARDDDVHVRCHSTVESTHNEDIDDGDRRDEP